MSDNDNRTPAQRAIAGAWTDCEKPLERLAAALEEHCDDAGTAADTVRVLRYRLGLMCTRATGGKP